MTRPGPLPPGFVSLGQAASAALANATERARHTDAVRERLDRLGYRWAADGETDRDGRRLVLAESGKVMGRFNLAEAEAFCGDRETEGARR